jgi:hypothetical protein
VQRDSGISAPLAGNACAKLGMVTGVKKVGLWRLVNQIIWMDTRVVPKVYSGIPGIATYISHNPDPSPFSASISIHTLK